MMSDIKSGSGRVKSFEYVAPYTRVEKFTRGPWRCSKKTDFVVVGENEDEIADASYGDNPQANTNLIAAAPDLYEAMKSCLNFMENTESELGISLESADQARAALAKARGES